MIKVMTIVGTRPEIIKMSLVIKKLDKYTNHLLVHTGQNYDYELNQIFFNELGIRKPDYFLESAKNNVASSIASIIEESDRIFEIEKPDALMLYGDTNSCLSVIAAKRRKIPIFHMEAGNRCFDQRVPEELNRKIVDHLSDVNLVLTEHARRYLISEGISSDLIFKTGSHMREVLNFFMPKIKQSNILAKLKLKSKSYFIVSFHREENLDNDKNFKGFLDSLNAIYYYYKLPIIVSTHPRTLKKLDSYKNVKLDKNITFVKPFGFFDYIHLQMNSFCLISDSGTVSEESALLSIPSVIIRDIHERPEGVDSGIFILSNLNEHNIMNAIRVVTDTYKESSGLYEAVKDYDPINVSDKIIKILFSYLDYINHRIWHR